MKEKGKRSHILCKKGQKKRDHKKKKNVYMLLYNYLQSK